MSLILCCCTLLKMRIYYAKRTFCCRALRVIGNSLSKSSFSLGKKIWAPAILGPFSLLFYPFFTVFCIRCIHWVKIPRSEFTKWCGQDWWLSYRHCGSSQCIWVGGERDHREEERRKHLFLLQLLQLTYLRSSHRLFLQPHLFRTFFWSFKEKFGFSLSTKRLQFRNCALRQWTRKEI